MPQIAASILLAFFWYGLGELATIGLLTGVVLMQLAHKARYGIWFDP